MPASARWSGAGVARLRHVPFALFLVGVLGYGVALAWYLLEHFDLLNLLRDANIDDAFYYFQIAYHMAEGRFSTFDGGLTRTNGYHPLWLFMITPVYWLFDKTEALFAIKAFEIMLLAGGVAAIAAAARTARLPWFLLFAALPLLYGEKGLWAGLEAAAALFVLGLLFLAVCLFARDPERWRWPLAAVVFVLPWVRMEYAAIAVAVPAALCVLEWTAFSTTTASASNSIPASNPPRWTDRLSLALRPARGGRGLPLRNAAVPLLGAAAGIIVYFIYNGIVFGGIVPVSGALKASWSQDQWQQADGYSLKENFHAFAQLPFFDNELLIALEVCVYALLVCWLSGPFRNQGDKLLLAFMVGMFGLAAGHLAKFAQNVLFMHPTWANYSWYYVPAYLMDALVVLLRCCVGIYLLRRFVAPRLPRTANVLRFCGIGAAALVLVEKVDFAEPFRFVDRVSGDVDLRNRRVRSYMGSAVMDRVLPEGTLVGAWDSGVIGYFSRLQVMNLDGLANSYAYKEAMDDGRDAEFWRRHSLFHFGNVYRDGFPVRLLLWAKSVSFERRFGVVIFDDTASSNTRRRRPRLGFDLHMEDDHLVYAKAPCTRDDVAARFVLRVVASSQDGLPGRAQLGYENLDFWFDHYGDRRDGACLARVPLPDYDIAFLRTGQYAVGVSTLFQAARGGLGPYGGLRWRAGRFDDVALQFKLYRDDAERVSSSVDRAAWFRERMAPHLEFQANGIGLLVEGRTAQAFAWDCTADGNEVAAWSFNGKVGAVSDWTQTTDGLCSSAILLPHGHQPPLRVRRAAPGEAAAGLAGGQALAIAVDPGAAGDANGFDVYLADDALVYVKAACGRSDVETPFFLHVVPAGDNFDDGREAHGFNNLDFMFERRGSWFGDGRGERACLAEVPLPGYRIAQVRTGQYSPADRRAIWTGTINMVEVDEFLARLVGGRLPVIAADSAHPQDAPFAKGFDVYLADDALVYVKAACGRSDVETPFFLHVVPAGDDFDDGREAHGFNNLDFMFERRGSWFGDGRGERACLAEVPLPGYRIAEIRTGQYTADGPVWEGEIRLDQLTTEDA